MAYSDPGDAVSGAVITEAWGDAVRADVVESALARVAAKGDITVATALNVLARLAVGADYTRLVADSGEVTGLKWQIIPSARVYNSGAFDPTPGAWDGIEFDSERYDTDTLHSVVGNTERITCPDDGSGIYHFGGSFTLGNLGLAGANSPCGIRILLNGATVIVQTTRDASRDHDEGFAISTDYAFSDNGGGANDFVELQVLTTSDVDVLAGGNYSPEFWCHFVREI